MKIPGYIIDLESAVKSINEKNYKKVVLQIPEGLKIHAGNFVDFLEDETDATIIICADPCFGACDIVNSNLDADFAIQIGHLPIPNIKNTSIPTVLKS